MGKTKKTSGKGRPASFEQALAEVEKIVHDLEAGKIGLAEALGRYEQGVQLLKDCYQLLEKAERRIELLSGVDAEGNPVVEPFGEEGESSLEAKSRARARRRSTAEGGGKPHRSAPSDVDGGQSLF
ncbi:MAG: exodeoxyribonuclease VII small subunit [Planctomycetales bacterium]|nr:exodeoxyribonuclease VII small subunit [Planctomycetales bacterium]